MQVLTDKGQKKRNPAVTECLEALAQDHERDCSDTIAGSSGCSAMCALFKAVHNEVLPSAASSGATSKYEFWNVRDEDCRAQQSLGWQAITSASFTMQSPVNQPAEVNIENSCF